MSSKYNKQPHIQHCQTFGRQTFVEALCGRYEAVQLFRNSVPCCVLSDQREVQVSVWRSAAHTFSEHVEHFMQSPMRTALSVALNKTGKFDAFYRTGEAEGTMSRIKSPFGARCFGRTKPMFAPMVTTSSMHAVEWSLCLSLNLSINVQHSKRVVA